MSTAPRYNKAEFDAFFERMIAGVDKVIQMPHNQPEAYPGDPGPEPIPEPSADDGYEEEPYWSDSDSTREMWNSIKGR